MSDSTFTQGILATPLPVALGGTGASTLTGLLLGNGTSAVTAITTSAGIAGAISDETGTGALVFATSPTLVTPTANRLGIGVAADAARLLLVQGNVTGGIATFERTTVATTSSFGTTIIKATSTGQMTDGFGAAFQFALQDADAVENIVGSIQMLRDGADNSAQFNFNNALAGVFSNSYIIKARGDHQFFNQLVTSGVAPQFTFVPSAHTGLTASTESSDVNFVLNRTIQFATGAITTQRAFGIGLPTYAFVGASTITNAATVYIAGAPAAGTNATITNSYGLWIAGGANRFDGSLSVGTSAKPTSLVTLGAGTASASTAPLKFTSGTNLTTAEAGANEFDGKVFYDTSVASSRQVRSTEQFVCLSSAYTLTSQTGVQQIFNSTASGALTVASSTTYQFECFFSLSALSTGASSFGFAFAGTATFTSQTWRAEANKAVLTSANQPFTSVNTAAQTNLTGNQATSTGYAHIRGILRINAGGTIIPQINLGIAAAAVVGSDSFFRAWPIGSNTVTTVGNWS